MGSNLPRGVERRNTFTLENVVLGGHFPSSVEVVTLLDQ